MSQQELIILSYHRFTAEDDPYVFSRTYKQFRNDIETKDFDWITIDDGHKSIVKACKMMQDANIRAKLFISTDLIERPGYCTWEDIWHLSRFHDIENHSHKHIKLTEVSEAEVLKQLVTANTEIKNNIGREPRFFVPPWNQCNETVLSIANKLGLQLVKDRIDIKNDTR